MCGTGNVALPFRSPLHFQENTQKCCNKTDFPDVQLLRIINKQQLGEISAKLLERGMPFEVPTDHFMP